MSSVQKLKRRAVEFEQKRQFDRALELYVQLLDEAGRDLPDDEVPLFNRVGDLLVRKGETAQALAYYERAVDAYAERGFLNNAIALCNKILRQSPGRAAIYYKLGKISARKGFRSDARKNFLEYADRMQKAGNLDEAFRALKEFAALYPEQDDVRLILADLLSRENRKGEALEQLQALYQKLENEGRRAEARATVERMKAIDPDVAVPAPTGEHRAASDNALVFLDLSGDEPRRPTHETSTVTPTRSAESHTAVPALDGLTLTFVPDHESADGAPAEATSEDIAGTPDLPGAATPLATPGEIAAADRGAPHADAPHADLPHADLAHADLPHADAPHADIPHPDAPSAGLIDDGASDDEDDEDDEVRTGEFPVPVEVQPIELNLEEHSRAFVGDLILEPEAPAPFEGFSPAGSDGTETAEHQYIIEQMPLTGAEFAGLPLSEAPRSRNTREHDLVVPLAIPQLGESDVAASSPAAPGAVETEPEVDAVAVDPAIEDLLGTGSVLEPTVEHEVPVAPDDSLAQMYRETIERVTGRPTPASEDDELRTIPRPEDLLNTPATFGRRESTEPPAFPPLPGFTEETGERSEARAGLFDPQLDSAFAPDEFLAGGEDLLHESAVGEGEAPVDAPLPLGMDNARESAPPARTGASTPRVTVSFGGAEGHLRQRLELDPENWGLRRQLGEALLDAGDRDGGLYELELAITGFELAGQLEEANTTTEVVLRVQPNSIRHHQKRVEFAVRLKDRSRLVEAYLELADALFRTGEGDKSIAVYARVAELHPNNERALFALATLAPDRVDALRGAPAHRDRWSEELEAIPAGALADPAITVATVERDAPSSSSTGNASAALAVEDEGDAEGSALSHESAAVEAAPAASAASEAPRVEDDEPLPAPAASDALEPHEAHDRAATLPSEQSPESVTGSASDEDPGLASDAASDAVPTALVTPVVEADHVPVDQAATPPAVEEREQQDAPPADGRHVHSDAVPFRPTPAAPILSIDAYALEDGEESAAHPAAPPPPAVPPAVPTTVLTEAAPAQAASRESPPLERAPANTSAAGADAGFFDLGDWLRETEKPRTTRMVVEEAKPTGDEQADFEELLRRFKSGLEENVDDEDYEAHYDLGVAFKEMGLVDEAIAEFQKALRGSAHRVRAYEALGTCFVEKAQYPIAAALLQRAIELPGTDDQQLVGVLYLLGFAIEQMGRHADALRYYQRVFAVDIRFRDVAHRVSAMEHLSK